MNKFFLVFILLTLKSFAWDSSVSINSSLDMKLKIICESDEDLCRNLCSGNTCEIESGYCKNCIGANSFISNFYREVGRLYQNTDRVITQEAASALLLSNKFIFLQAQSPFNIYSGVNDLRIERYFESLCHGDFSSRPIVLAKLDRNHKVQKVTHVICHGDFGGEVFEMSHAGD
jgi:hypothetical protein